MSASSSKYDHVLAMRTANLLFTYMNKQPSGSIQFESATKLVDYWLWLKKEVFRWGIATRELTGFLSATGYRLVRTCDADYLAKKYLPDKKYNPRKRRKHLLGEGGMLEPDACTNKTESRPTRSLITADMRRGLSPTVTPARAARSGRAGPCRRTRDTTDRRFREEFIEKSRSTSRSMKSRATRLITSPCTRPRCRGTLANCRARIRQHSCRHCVSVLYHWSFHAPDRRFRRFAHRFGDWSHRRCAHYSAVADKSAIQSRRTSSVIVGFSDRI